jgi:hypothetical protein
MEEEEVLDNATLEETAAPPETVETTETTDNSTTTEVAQNNPSAFIFKEGKSANVTQYITSIETKLKTINQTILPLIEVSLIELLGKSSAYERLSANITMNNQDKFDCKFIYQVSLWIIQESEEEEQDLSEALKHDASYVFDKIKMIQGVEYKSCLIDSTIGQLIIDFSI